MSALLLMKRKKKLLLKNLDNKRYGMCKVKIKVDDIKKVKEFEDKVIIYTSNQYWVCVKEQKMPTKDDVFITLQLKPKK